MPTALQIRQTFIDYFLLKEHKIVSGSSVIPKDDPTLLFTNAGMNQFKPYITGESKPEFSRVANTQMCIRAGGKHNDFDDVGKDSYHHTCFEMLGNWSFGDYGKEEAISYAWELLTDYYQLDPLRIYVTYHEGDSKMEVDPDTETRNLWRKYLPDERILTGSTEDNFWEMGETGTCGPCTEIHYDLIGERDAAGLVNQDDPTVVELWNLVFTQFDKNTDGKLTPLETMTVDTGMGFERLVAIIQNKKSNYAADVFAEIFSTIEKSLVIPSYEDVYGDEDKEHRNTAYRIVADHVRALAIALHDGGEFGSNGAPAILRRLLRRAMLYATEYLGAHDDFVPLLVCSVLTDMYQTDEEWYENMVATLMTESKKFIKSLATGKKEMAKAVMKLKKTEGTALSGETMFKLHATFGFPPELQLALSTKLGVEVDMEGYRKKLQEHHTVSNVTKI